jgi:hypothetical protein
MTPLQRLMLSRARTLLAVARLLDKLATRLGVLGVASGGPISFPQLLPVIWAANLTAAGGLVYNSTKGNRAVCVVDFGGTRAANPFTVSFPANGPDSAFMRVIGSLVYT